MSLKYYLKQAKERISSNDPETALEYVDDVLEIDSNNYFAYIFQGKSHQLLEQWEKGLKSFAKATEIEPSNLLGWKGYYQTAMSSGDHDAFFKVLGLYINKQYEQELPLSETINEAKRYLKFYDYEKNLELKEKYLLFLNSDIIPESISVNFLSRIETLRQLIQVVSKRENNAIKDLINKEKYNLPPKLPTTEVKRRLNEVKWTVYRNSTLGDLYRQLINVCDDDEERASLEEELVKYKYDVLLSSPNKEKLVVEIKELVEGMVLVKHKSFFIWSLFFDWKDFESFSELDWSSTKFFIKNFAHEGLAQVLYAFVLSDISPFDRKKVIEELTSKKNSTSAKDNEIESNSETLELEKLEEEDAPETIEFDAIQTLESLNQSLLKCPTSIFANRIVCKYCIHQHEYEEASIKCKDAIRLLAENQRCTGIDLIHAREDILSALAIVYTYHEAPKNHAKALALYNKILEDTPQNSQAIIGKGLILIEKGQFEEAKEILENATKSFPDIVQAKIELSWCLIKMKDFEQGRKGLLECIEQTTGLDVHSAETRALLNWRIAYSYDGIDMDQAYKYYIQSLKESKTFAPSYTALGVLYQEHYNDIERAQKCFYKAFELDVGEITAAKYLVADLTNKEEWEVAEVLCKRIVNTDRSRRALISSPNMQDRSWPYRVLGCSALNRQEDNKAVEWFQTALRMVSMDLECWLGLGEAYFNCGRLDAAAKVLGHVLSSNDSWQIKYMLGVVLSEMGNYEEAIKLLESALNQSKDECTICALYSSLIAYASSLITQGFFGRAFAINLKAVDYLQMAANINNTSQALWKSASDSLKLFMIVQEFAEDFPMSKFEEIINTVPEKGNVFLQELQDEDFLQIKESSKYHQKISCLIVKASKCAINVLPVKSHKLIRSIAYYNLGLAYLESFKANIEETGFRNAAIKCLKKAIQIEPSNASFWVALGNAFASSNPQIAQHCLIKSISLDPKAGDIWNNLAALYLRYGDYELAEEAFSRASSISPTQSKSWIGHALLKQDTGNSVEASRLFTHAYVLSKGADPLAQLLYGFSVLNKRLQSGCDPRDVEAAQEFSVANFALSNYMKCAPQDEVGLKVAIIVSERCKNYEQGIELGKKLASLLELKYEETESETVLIEFASVKTSMARMYLGIGSFENAIETAETALQLIGSEKEHETSVMFTELQSIVLSSRITIGLAFFFQDKFDDSLDQLKLILAKNSDSKRLITLTAQILFAYKSEDTKQAAVDQLFAFIEEFGSSLLVVLTLGAISIVDNLDEYLGAIKDELEGLSLNELVGDTIRIVPQLIDEINTRLNDKNHHIWKRNALLFPQDYHVWQNINKQMAVRVATLSETKLAACETSTAYSDLGVLRAIQRSLIINPENIHAKRSLEAI